MGMAASQARYIELAARKTNVEYEGQQINQQRTALANESAGLFNSMLQLNVPTAPNYSQFVKTIYSFSDGTNDYTIDSFARTSEDPSYNAKVNYYYTTTEYTGVYKERSDLELHWETASDGSKILYYGTKKLEQYDPQKDEAAVRQIYTDTVKDKTDHPVMDETMADSLVGLNYKAYLDAGETEAALETLKGKIWSYASGGTTYYISTDNMGTTKSFDAYKDGTTLTITPNSGTGITTYVVKDSGGNLLKTINATYKTTDSAMTLTSATGIELTTEVTKSGGNTITTCRYNIPATALTQNTHTSETISTQPVQNCYAKDLTTKQWQKGVNAYLDKDDSGNYKSITLENYSNSFDLNVFQETDDVAYNNAMNDYVYQKAMYDKNIADINAKTEIIQQEDRTLELKLKQLDTEHNALQTEMDAVKKVCDKNVEDTFKTFG